MIELLTTREVAVILRLSEMHVRKLINTKILNGYKEGRKGGFRVPSSEVERYIKERTYGLEA